MIADSPTAARSRSGFVWVGLILPLAIIVSVAAMITAWLPELPDPVAIHWGTNGVDGFGPRWATIALPLGVGGGVVVLLAVMSLFAHRLPRSSHAPAVQAWGPTARLLGGVNLGVALMISSLSLATAGVQRGLDDASLAPGVSGWVLLGFGLLVIGTAAGWFLQPKSPLHPSDSGTRPEAIALAQGERAAWFGTASMARGGVLTLAALLTVLLATTAFEFARGGAGGWILAAVAVLMVCLVCTMLVFRVRVNGEGLLVRSVGGWPSIRIPLDRISAVEIVEVAPMAEFGGWGWRVAVDGRRGVVLRAGEALQVAQSGGPVLVVTVDGARDAAALLEALRNRASQDN
ncbi:DUF1648 domain-containing protein [Microbacterium sp.]|uniref:DUF1648 domain-containing protein n=1 Tax=Microbacterium sp. TaxID=51671 RepID=UPI002811A348|nr:DUF1648 domain-containing protein [Microbacterium sp.]